MAEAILPFKRKMKRKLEKIAAAGIVLLGLALMFYPWISNYLYDHRVDSTVGIYQDQIKSVDEARIGELMEEARAYNEELSRAQVTLTDPFVEEEKPDGELNYTEMLRMDDSGIMCFLEIPKIGLELPVYHGTSSEVLEKGVGHIEKSALPIGGKGCHSVLSAHTGINSSKMFTDLVMMEEGDLFFLRVLNQTLAYRVVEVQVIEPEDTGSLLADPERDLVSLLTCTPYGVNTHRLVVTGERTEYSPAVREEAEEKTGNVDSLWMQSYKKAMGMGLLIVGGFCLAMKIYGFLGKRRKRRRRLFRGNKT